MSRYIDADKIPYTISEDGCLDDFAYRYDINEVPTADVVEVVRCKDCIFANVEDGKIKCYNTYGMLICTENEYCSRGRRSENGKS